jgi:hypothetical protein
MSRCWHEQHVFPTSRCLDQPKVVTRRIKPDQGRPECARCRPYLNDVGCSTQNLALHWLFNADIQSIKYQEQRAGLENPVILKHLWPCFKAYRVIIIVAAVVRLPIVCILIISIDRLWHKDFHFSCSSSCVRSFKQLYVCLPFLCKPTQQTISGKALTTWHSLTVHSTLSYRKALVRFSTHFMETWGILVWKI